MSATICALSQLHESRELAAAAGGKARRLALMRQHGLRVADGFVVLPGEISGDALTFAAQTLGSRFVVRSSSAIEDSSSGAAPGVFSSLVNVGPDQLFESVCTVRLSAESETARAYCEAFELSFPPAIAVVVQPHLAHEIRGTIYTQSGADGHGLTCEVVDTAGSVCSSTVGGSESTLLDGLEPTHAAELVKRAFEIESLFGFGRGADIEWLVSAGQLWIVQARELVAPIQQPRQSPPTNAFPFAIARPDIVWKWDVSHNPRPLSKAQQGLVQLVAAELKSPLELARGYLYEAVLPTGQIFEELELESLAAELESTFFEAVAPRLDRELATLEGREANLERALALFVRVNDAYATELRPVLSQAKRVSTDRSNIGIGSRLLANIADPAFGFGSVARDYATGRAARGERWYWKPYADEWDVATPAFEESPQELSALVTKLESVSSHSSPPPGQLARVVHAVSELDDRLFYRAQRLVRRAIAALEGDIDASLRFELELSELRCWSKEGTLKVGAFTRARNNRDDRVAAEALAMPLFVQGTKRPTPLEPFRTLRGVGVGPATSGAVTFNTVSPGCILVARDLTPGDVIRALNAAAIVLETTQQLGHAAALARELGVPLMTGVVGATTLLSQGERIWIDPGAGLVVRMGR